MCAIESRFSTDDLVCRKLAPADFPQIAPWYLTDGPDWTWLLRFSEDPAARVYVCAAESPVAVIWYRLVADEAELLDLRVDQKARGLGVGGLLMRVSLATLVEAKIARCHLEVRASNTVAQRLYQRHGFEEVGRRRDYYPSSAVVPHREDAILMARSLP